MEEMFIVVRGSSSLSAANTSTRFPYYSPITGRRAASVFVSYPLIMRLFCAVFIAILPAKYLNLAGGLSPKMADGYHTSVAPLISVWDS